MNVSAFLIWGEQPHSVRTKAGSVSAMDLRGVQENFGQVYAKGATVAGRFISEGDDLHREKVVMLGENVAPVLFPNGDPIGKDVTIDGSDFQVIGVVEKPKGGFAMGDEDRRVLIPYNTFRKIYPGAYENMFRVQAYSKMLDQAVDQATEVLRRRRNVACDAEDSFSIQTAEQQVEEFHSIMLMTYVAMIVLSSIGLLIGGVGVMNIMLVSVTERTREIGIRKAIGAKRGDITWQFLLEAMTLTGAGGAVALVLLHVPLLPTPPGSNSPLLLPPRPRPTRAFPPSRLLPTAGSVALRKAAHEIDVVPREGRAGNAWAGPAFPSPNSPRKVIRDPRRRSGCVHGPPR